MTTIEISRADAASPISWIAISSVKANDFKVFFLTDPGRSLAHALGAVTEMITGVIPEAR